VPELKALSITGKIFLLHEAKDAISHIFGKQVLEILDSLSRRGGHNIESVSSTSRENFTLNRDIGWEVLEDTRRGEVEVESLLLCSVGA
jgi:hypothetical protein